MQKQKYFVKGDYECSKVRTGGKWFILECSKKPIKGIIKEKPLPPHECRKYLYSQECENDPDCETQRINEVKPYSENNAEKLEALCLS